MASIVSLWLKMRKKRKEHSTSSRRKEITNKVTLRHENLVLSKSDIWQDDNSFSSIHKGDKIRGKK